MKIQFDDSVVSMVIESKSRLFQVIGSQSHNEELSDILAYIKGFQIHMCGVSRIKEAKARKNLTV